MGTELVNEMSICYIEGLCVYTCIIFVCGQNNFLNVYESAFVQFVNKIHSTHEEMLEFTRETLKLEDLIFRDLST